MKKTIQICIITLLLVNISSATLSNAEFGLGLTTGVWFPTGDAKILGPHPVLGVSIIGRNNRISMRIDFQQRFLESSHDYNVTFLGETKTTREFSSTYLGILGEFDLYQRATDCFSIVSGVGIDAIQSCKIRDTTHIINDNAITIGFAYRNYISQRLFIKPQILYTFVNYDNLNGTSLKGNTISLLLTLSLGRKPMAYNEYK